MNILFAYPTGFNPNKGGVERVTDSLTKALLQLGFNVYYLNWERKEDKYDYPVPVIDLPSPKLQDPQNILFYKHFLSENNINVVINQHGLYEGTYFLSQANPNVKIISVLHNNPLGIYSHLWSELIILKNPSLKEKIKRAIRIILYYKIKYDLRKSILMHYRFFEQHPQILCFLSDSYKNSIRTYCKLPNNCLISIANPNTYSNITYIPAKKPYLLFVGRLYNRSKKLQILLQVWKKISKAYPKWKLIIVGDGPDKEVLIKIANNIPNIEFTGYKNPQKYYEEASIFCLTSIFEGFPMCLTEAMQFGCVPIAFDSFPAVRDVIIPGETGELVKPFNKKEYIHKLTHLMEDENYRAQLSQKGFEYVKKFDISNILPKWIELINQ